MDILKELETIKESNNHRSLKTARINGANIEIEGKNAVNSASKVFAINKIPQKCAIIAV